MEYNNIAPELDREYEQRRLDNFARYRQHQEEACEKCPGLRELLDRRHLLVTEGIRFGILNRGQGKLPGNSAEEMRGLNGQIRSKLAEAGLSEDYLRPVYTCPLCKDEGFVYNPNRTMCECYRRELSRRLLEGCANPHHCFEAFDLNLFSDKCEEGQSASQRKQMARNRACCEEYANQYPDTRFPNLVMIGKSGLGKTYLLECIAHRLAEKGVFPTMVTAYDMFDTLRESYFNREESRARELLEADPLLIDDLGTEPLLNNITVEMLFRLLDERGRKGGHTLISTNLNQNELRERYTERITSRLLDPSATRTIRFEGRDVRKQPAPKGAGI